MKDQTRERNTPDLGEARPRLRSDAQRRGAKPRSGAAPSAAVLDLTAAVVRGVALLTATAMTRLGASAAGGAALDAFLILGALYVLISGLLDRMAPRWRLNTDALVCLDVFYITGLVWHTGGLASEFYLLYYLPILNASMRLDFRQAILSSLLAAACYAFITVAAGLESTVRSSAAVQLATFGGSAAVLALFFGSVAALSGSQRELTGKLQDAVERLSALYRIARAVHARDSLQNVMDTTLELAMELVGAYAGYVALGNDAGELLVKCSRRGNPVAPGPAPDDQPLTWARLGLASGATRSVAELSRVPERCTAPPAFDRQLAEHALVARAPLVTTGARALLPVCTRPLGPSGRGGGPGGAQPQECLGSTLGPSREREVSSQCTISAPLIYGDAAYGAVQLFLASARDASRRSGDEAQPRRDAPECGEAASRTSCDQRTLELLAALTQEAAVAMENARLRAAQRAAPERGQAASEVHRLAGRPLRGQDELTGLYHRSEFRRLLEAEVDRARVNGGAVAVLLFDIDGMRAINAEHGHEAGDEVLLACADMLRRSIRSQDIAARYGGDEFAVLLPGGGIDAARAVSSRLCHNLAHHAFHFAGDAGARDARSRARPGRASGAGVARASAAQPHPAHSGDASRRSGDEAAPRPAHHFTLSAGVVVASAGLPREGTRESPEALVGTQPGGSRGNPDMPDNADQLVGRADEALFEARQAGGGQIRFWQAPRSSSAGVSPAGVSPARQRGIVTQLRQIVEGRPDPTGPERSSGQWR